MKSTLSGPAGVSPVEERVARAGGELGVAATSIERLPFDLSVLEAGGVFINVDAANFGLLDRRLDWQALGITLPRGSDLAFRPPRCGLVPDRYRLPLLRPPAHAHTALHRYSYHFRLVETIFETSAYRWLPWRAWPEFERAFAAACARLAAALDDYEANFVSIRETVLAAFTELAADSARRLEATGQPVRPTSPKRSFAECCRLCQPRRCSAPACRFAIRVGVMQLGSELWAEQRRAAEERRRIEALEDDRLSDQRRRAAEERLVQEQLWSEQQRLRQQRLADEQEREREAAIKEQLRQLKLQAARERLQEALSPLEEGAQQLHAVVFEAASALRASLQKNQALRGSSARKARELCRWFVLMNWTGDQQLEALITELEQLATAPVAAHAKARSQADRPGARRHHHAHQRWRPLEPSSRTAWPGSSSDHAPYAHQTRHPLRAARGGHCMTTTSNRELPATEALIVSLDEYIRARYGLLAVQTFEEERFVRFMRGVADHERHRAKGLYLWSRTRGLRLVAGPGVGAEPRPIPNREDALSLDRIHRGGRAGPVRAE